ncbi:ABC transporter ATP-binding protein [Halomonas desiderata]|uniref:ABC transporter ATP-binding protein n=1 Tax=Billgrantia desiderata TaxID=52021 RepID=UPI00089F5D6A|nr:ABC transporter ATP-binding protein [Halomonas desiderata]MCE8010585.1 ABC transporter ATP-binding protein [Halomonas desiderata]NIC35198.1 ABC transporter ATP-binding protein [Halomonas desiderata]SEF63508.1 NitT/TauT family transport system ATP-binding protein [Halomonas desiderata]
MSLLEAKRLEKHYGDHVVLERLDFRVEAGEFVTLVGASGCGKTTFLKMLLGTERISRGSLTLDQRPIPEEPGPDRGVVFQKYSVFPHLTVLGNVMIAEELSQSRWLGKSFGTARRQARDKAMARIEEVGLANALGKYPHELSGGMQQRLAIAQALMMRPRILLLDEPFGALDPGIRRDMHELILTLWKEQQLTIFMITHDLKEAFALGTRLWVFDKLRHDPQAPEAFGATITYDLPIGERQPPADLSARFAERGLKTLTQETLL